ncbi:CUB domain-containing protein 2-like isoform X2 [Physella acuta]|uniref:CUB domain-containing protein 2-like isoform X2 n=1 Tax=Physella acuta TaxID=109671 RepID=UPI0027DE115E|nr:CUB domain-containing protein 2-like isoform X2 [Physella acuta]
MMSCDLWMLVMVPLFISTIVPSKATHPCNYTFSYVTGPVGNFSSPGFPGYYPSLLRCTYFFDAARNGGVEIKFEAFELEDEFEDDDVYDYIEVYTLDSQGFKALLNKFCGSKIPQTIISPQSKLEIKFITDHWQNSARGFSGTYRFLGDEWQPFDHKPNHCGSENLSGIAGFIQSPNYPKKYPRGVNCSWVIRVPERQQILVRLLDLDIGEGPKCGDSKLLLYNGYATPLSVQTLEWCGHKSHMDADELQYVTFTNRTVVRFVSGLRNNNHIGFKLMWMAVSLPKESEVCRSFQCEGGKYCLNGQPCKPLPKYCISQKLVCDGVRNCGPFDDSDERKCTKEILIIAACISVPSIVLLMLVVLITYCYKTRHVKKSLSQDQPLTNSQSQGTTSHDSFPSNSRQMMLHTSFMDGASPFTSDPPDLSDTDPTADNSLFTDAVTGSLKSHKKRPSYHMMQLNYEDGNLMTSQI